MAKSKFDVFCWESLPKTQSFSFQTSPRICSLIFFFKTSPKISSLRFWKWGLLMQILLAPRAFSRLRISAFTQNFWVFSFYIADFWQTFWVIWENGSNWSNLRLKMSFFALGRLKNHKVPHLHPNSTMFMPLDRLQLKIYAFSGKFNVCSKRVLLSWIQFGAILRSKLRFFLRNTGVDSDFTQNFWGKNWQLGALEWRF